MTRHLGVLLDWTLVDLIAVAIGVQQYISISRDLKRTKAREAAEKNQ
jgi:hypothetical protein